MIRSRGVLVTLGAGAGLLSLMVGMRPLIADATSPAAAQQAAPVAPTGIDDQAVVGIAAISGAGVEVRHAMKVAGPDPVVDVTPSPDPTKPARRASSVSGIAAAWHSGASGDAASDGSFGSWRGEPLQVVGSWSDGVPEEQRDVTSLDKYRDYNGDVDIALGGLASGESYAQAASGAFTDRWTQAIRNVKAKRAGQSGTTYIRIFHEMTGDWFDWKVDSGNVGDFKKSWRLFHDILEREYPQAKLVFSPNDGNHSGVDLEQIYPGDDVVDVIGPDSYDGYPDKTNESLWDEAFSATKDGPMGLGAWQNFARAHHKPMALPEWGLRFSDNPFYIQKMHEFLASCAPKPGDTDLSGKCIYDIYFNIVNNGNSKFVIYGGSNPNAADVYKSMTWGTR